MDPQTTPPLSISPQNTKPQTTPQLELPTVPKTKNTKSILLWLLVGLIVILIAVSIPVGLSFLPSSSAEVPVQTANTLLKNIAEGNFTKAYGLFDTTEQSQLSQGAFIDMVTSSPVLAQNKDATFTAKQISQNTAQLDGTITSIGGIKQQISFILVKQGNIWLIDVFSLGKIL